MTGYDKFKEQLLEDPQVEAEYNAMEPEFDIIQALIDTRKKQNLTQKELSERTGITQADISRIENRTRNPSLDMIKRLASGMGMHLKLQFIPKPQKKYINGKEKKTQEQAIEDLTLMLMYLTRQQENNDFCRYMELSWKGYDFDTLDKLEADNMLYQPSKSKLVYLSEAGRNRAMKLIEEYGFADKDINERFEFREVRPEEADEVAQIEQICFPPNEACSVLHMKERAAAAPELFMVAVDKETGKIAGFLNGLATNEYSFRDAFFEDAELHKPDGKNVMLLGLDVLPEYRKQGLAKEIMFQYLRKEWDNDRKIVILTCLQSKVKMYKKMGFRDMGIADSNWGGEEWHEMCYVLNA
ncbi:acetyltransferase (GNAT) family protein [Muricomes intestini]|uniref:Acetyltransferase (GNAT) family protein n=2 Tax=Muricomes intestini TaxID=1796634 RepID=A0A4R3JZX6_9FIRM|nr:acetyltransferase (GNAT) family protein [Muricomes intestini]